MKEVGTKVYGYGANLNPFSGRVVCGHCGSLYLRKSWGSRGIHLWQCRNHMEKGKLNCHGRNIKESDLNRTFILAWNQIVMNREKCLTTWENMLLSGSALDHIRAKQFLELTSESLLSEIVPELVQLVLERVTIILPSKMEFKFLDGSSKKIVL